MLQTIHDKIQGLFAWVIAVILALAFALWGIQNYLHGGRGQAVAEVNGKKITQEKFRIAYERAKRNVMSSLDQSFSFDQKNQALLKKEILQQLINQEILFQAENEMGLGVGKRQLLGAITSMPVFQVDGRFSLDVFKQKLDNALYSEQTLIEEVKGLLLHSQLITGIVNSAFVLPNEIEFIKKVFKQRRDFGYFIVSPESFIKRVEVNDEGIKNYYTEHQNEFLLPEKISIQYIELSSSNLQDKVKPTAEQLKQFYQSHIDSFSTPKKWQVTKVFLPIAFKADSKVVDNAKKKMEDIAIQLKSRKGLSNVDPEIRVTTFWITSGDTSKDFITYLNKLDVNQVSTVFRTKDGFNLIKVLAKQEAKITPYENVVTKVKEVYEHQQLTQAFSEASDKLSDLVYINSDTLEPASKELNLEIKETGLVTHIGSKEGILANNKVIKAAFSDTVLKQRYNSNLIEIGSGKVIVLRIKDYVPEKLQILEQVRGSIIEKLQHQKAQKVASDLANELLQALINGKNENELSRKYNLTWYKLFSTKYGQNDSNAELIDTAFSLDSSSRGTKNISAKIIDFNGGYAVLRLDKVYDDASHTNDTKIDSVIKSMPETFGQFDYQTTVNNLKSQAKVKIIDKAEEEQQANIYE